MKKNKLNYRIFRALFILLFIIFIALYFSEASGYYEFRNFKTKELTEKQIKKFESDVANGKNVSIEDYVITRNKDYSNNLSNVGFKLSKSISRLVENSLNNTFSFINKLIEE